MNPLTEKNLHTQKRDDSIFQEIWEEPIGKVAIIGISCFAFVGITYGVLKAATLLMHASKDFRDALNR